MNNAEDQAKTAGQAETQESLDIEISDLPPETRSHFLLLSLVAAKTRLLALLASHPQETNARSQPGRTQRLSRKRVSRALLSSGLWVALLFLLVSDIPVPSSGPGEPSPTSNSIAFSQIQLILVSSTPNYLSQALGPLPASCPKIDELTPLPPNQSGLQGVGGDPLWLVGFSGPEATLHNLLYSSIAGWYATLTLYIPQGFTGSLILNGWNQTTGAELGFGDPLSPGQLLRASLELDLSHPNDYPLSSKGIWKTMPINLLIPFAGCYSLDIDWHTASRTVYFRAGN